MNPIDPEITTRPASPPTVHRPFDGEDRVRAVPRSWSALPEDVTAVIEPDPSGRP